MLETRADNIFDLLKSLDGVYKKETIVELWNNTGQPPLSLYELMAFVGQFVLAKSTYPDLCEKEARLLLVKEANLTQRPAQTPSTTTNKTCGSCGGGVIR